MNKQRWITIKGIIKQGYQIASGQAINSPYPQGSIKMQLPFFQALGLDIAPFFSGTLNVFIYPYKFTIKQPEYTFRKVKWNVNSPAEDFSFSRCFVEFNNEQYKSLIYYPHPETKPTHFQDSSTLEILAPLIADIYYGDSLQIILNLQEIQLRSVNSTSFKS